MTACEEVLADYSAHGLSVRGHPMQFMRAANPRRIPQITALQAREGADGKTVRIAGYAIVRQRPPTAKGTVFATFEDETGFLDLILHKKTYARHRELFVSSSFLIATGRIQREGLSISMIVRRLEPMYGDRGEVIANLEIPFGKFFS